MFNKLKDIGFTRQDTLVISFLVLTFLGGLVVKYASWEPAPTFNYSESDKQFEQSVKNAFNDIEKQPLSKERQSKLVQLNSLSDSLKKSYESQNQKHPELKIEKKININTAKAEDLELLPGIKETMANRIIDYRTRNGNFKKVEDIMNVKGIGEKKFANMKDYITVE